MDVTDTPTPPYPQPIPERYEDTPFDELPGALQAIIRRRVARPPRP